MCDPSVVGPQAFESASAFNANIGAWNTAAVTSMNSVSAVSAVACNVANSCARSGNRWLYTHVAIEM
jgi:surface protein